MKYIKLFESKDEIEYEKVKNLVKTFLDEREFGWDKFSSGEYYMKNYHEHIDDFKNYMKINNVDFDSFIKKYWNRVFSDDFFTKTCGFLDALLYEYDNKFPLGGDDYRLLDLEDSSPECEHIIKYNYDYQNYELSKKYILQAYDNLEDFYFACAEHYTDYLFIKGNYIIQDNRDWKNYANDIEMNKNSVKLFSEAVRYGDSSVCFIDLRALYNFVSNGKSTYNKFVDKFDREWVVPDILDKNQGWCAEYFGEDNKKDIILKKVDRDSNKIKEEIEFRNSVHKYNL